MTMPPQDPQSQPGQGAVPGQSAVPDQGAVPGQSAASAPVPGAIPVPGPGEPFDGATNPDDLRRPLYGAGLGVAIKRFFKSYVNFKGRASRSEFWWAMLFTGILGFVGWLLFYIGLGTATAWQATHQKVSNLTMEDGTPYTYDPGLIHAPTFALMVIGLILSLVIALGLLLPTWGIAWRRLHDANFAGPLALLCLIPYVGWIPVAALAIMAPKPEGRRFDRR